ATLTAETHTLSLHDALPIWVLGGQPGQVVDGQQQPRRRARRLAVLGVRRPLPLVELVLQAPHEAVQALLAVGGGVDVLEDVRQVDRKSTRLNSSHLGISYAV